MSIPCLPLYQLYRSLYLFLYFPYMVPSSNFLAYKHCLPLASDLSFGYVAHVPCRLDYHRKDFEGRKGGGAKYEWCFQLLSSLLA